jgi:Zn-dependent protease with chaperone function
MTVSVFSSDEVERARRYHRPLYAAFALGTLLSLSVPAVLAFTPVGDAMYGLVDDLAWWAATPAFTAMIVLAGFVIGLPLSYWRSYVRERAWGFSTQTLGGWLADRAKGLAVGLILTGAVMTALIGLIRAFPRAWPLVVAPAGMVLVVVMSFLAPVLLEPLFNRFTPLADQSLAAELRSLSEQAGVPVREVLVADASRRTRKENAYVSGLGRTRRVVLYDTLLARDEPRQVRLVVAHELGHRRMRHVLWATVLAMAGMSAAVVVLWALLELDPVLSAVGAAGPGDPRVVPFVLFVGGVLGLATMPLQSSVSRRWESAADRFSLKLTGDPDVFEESHRALALSNLSDLDPPRAVYVMSFSHPTPPERIEMARRWGGDRTRA